MNPQTEQVDAVSPAERTGRGGLPFVSGVRTIFLLEMRQRLRARSWYIMLAIWFVVIGLVFGLAVLTTATVGVDNGGVLFDLVVGFVLFFGLLVAPGLSANAVNGDRVAGTLAVLQVTLLTPSQILAGKWLAAWTASLGFLAAATPFTLWALALGGVDPLAAVVSILMLAVELGVVCAVGIGVSALASRPLFSIVTTYMLVAMLGIGTLIAFGLSMPLVQEDDVEVVYSYSTDGQQYGPRQPSAEAETPLPATDCQSETYRQTVYHTERSAWLLAANPFVVVADAVPYAPVPPSVRDGSAVYRQPGVMEFLSIGVREAQAGPDLEYTCEESYLGARELQDGQIPIWPLGLGLQLLLAGALLVAGRARLATPAHRIPRGTRIA